MCYNINVLTMAIYVHKRFEHNFFAIFKKVKKIRIFNKIDIAFAIV